MNTKVIIILIACATAIALVAIICDYLYEKKSTVSTDYLKSKKIIKIHRNYIVGFLGFAVIMLITSKFGGPNNSIFAYLSFGSTITSFVLSVLAIFVTVQSSSDLYKQFARIDSATENIKSVSSQIDETLRKLSDAELNLSNTSNNISAQMDDIVIRIDNSIKARMKETEDNISNKFEESLNNSSQTSGLQIPNNEAMKIFKEYFVSMTSANGLLAIYACTLSKEKEKMFKLSDLFKGNESYTFGYLIAAISTALVQFNSDKTNNEIECTESIFESSYLMTEIKKRLSQQNLGSDFFVLINNINKYFDLEPLKITIG